MPCIFNELCRRANKIVRVSLNFKSIGGMTATVLPLRHYPLRYVECPDTRQTALLSGVGAGIVSTRDSNAETLNGSAGSVISTCVTQESLTLTASCSTTRTFTASRSTSSDLCVCVTVTVYVICYCEFCFLMCVCVFHPPTSHLEALPLPDLVPRGTHPLRFDTRRLSPPPRLGTRRLSPPPRLGSQRLSLPDLVPGGSLPFPQLVPGCSLPLLHSVPGGSLPLPD